MAILFVLDAAIKGWLEALCARYAVRSLKLFGSGARVDFDPVESDLDFLVIFDEPPAGMRLATQYFSFLEGLQAMFGKPVDLLEENAIENSRMKKSATEGAGVLYAA